VNDRSPRSPSAVRIIAFYLPQFHPIPENDRWWGEGFTEWTNVRKARPNYYGHYQPHVPGELGYYDLRDITVQERQAGLAAEHGIHGFCYYYYWFNRKRLLEHPLEQMLDSGRPDFPFCVCWANENWTRRWDGRDQDVLIAQHYGIEDSRALIHALMPLFADRRHIRIGDRPLFIVYKPAAIPDLRRTSDMWREECVRVGVGNPYLCAAITSWYGDPASIGFDALVEFPPHQTAARGVALELQQTNPDFSGMVLGYRNYVAQMLTPRSESYNLFRTLIPAWDNTARRQNAATTFAGSSPEVFGYWLEEVIEQTRLLRRPDERLVFINAWNEWAEGCHLEPDQRYGRQYLEAVRAAIHKPPPIQAARSFGKA
jgi:lipopolysaccharide biosynthesis protein